MEDPSLELDVPALRAIRAIAEHGSITAAAVSLGYSQPAVSQQLRRLEERLGMPVTERVGRGVRLTEAGRVIARHAGAMTTALDAAAGELAELRGLRSGRVRVVGFPSASPTIMPRFIREMGERHPGIGVRYVEAEPPEAVAAVREDRADIALTFSYPGDRDDPHRESARGLDVTAAGHDPMYVVLPEAHSSVASDAVDLAELAGESWIAGCPRCRGHLLELCGTAGFTPRIAFETDNFVAVEGMVATGIGVAVLPGLALESAGVRPGVVVRPTAAADERTLHLVTAHGSGRVPAVAAALRVLGELIPPASPRHAHGGGTA